MKTQRESLIEKVHKEYNMLVNEQIKYHQHFFDYSKFKELRGRTGIKPSEGIMQKAYEDILNTGQTHRLIGLIQATGIKPKSKQCIEMIQREYDICIRGSGYITNLGPDDLKKLYMATGIKPIENIVQRGYTACIKDRQLNELGDLVKITGIKPKLSDNFIQENYSTFIKELQLNNVKQLQKITGIKPSEDTVQKGYLHYFEEPLEETEDECCVRLRGWKDKFKELQKITGIKPSKETVQKGYAIFVNKGRLDYLKKIYKTTGIKPSEEIYQSLTRDLLN